MRFEVLLIFLFCFLKSLLEKTNLRYPLWRNEAGGFHNFQASPRELVDKLDFDIGFYELWLVLKSISWTNLDNFDAGRKAELILRRGRDRRIFADSAGLPCCIFYRQRGGARSCAMSNCG